MTAGSWRSSRRRTQPLAPVVGDRLRFDVRPIALTNPVFLDVDGNGKYDPPEKHGAHEPHP